jgi:hypothetical protein
MMPLPVRASLAGLPLLPPAPRKASAAAAATAARRSRRAPRARRVLPRTRVLPNETLEAPSAGGRAAPLHAGLSPPPPLPTPPTPPTPHDEDDEAAAGVAARAPGDVLLDYISSLRQLADSLLDTEALFVCSLSAAAVAACHVSNLATGSPGLNANPNGGFLSFAVVFPRACTRACVPARLWCVLACAVCG